MSVVGGLLALTLMVARKTVVGDLIAVGSASLSRRLSPMLAMAGKAAPDDAAETTAGPAWIRRLLEPTEALPYGVAIAVGALIAFPSSPVVQALGGH